MFFDCSREGRVVPVRMNFPCMVADRKSHCDWWVGCIVGRLCIVRERSNVGRGCVRLVLAGNSCLWGRGLRIFVRGDIRLF